MVVYALPVSMMEKKQHFIFKAQKKQERRTKGMYVIGRSKGDYIRLVNSKGIEYSHSINLASIFTSLEKAELMIGYIKENIDSLYFANATILGNIIDKEKSFDKVAYVNELKIYELVPTELSIYED